MSVDANKATFRRFFEEAVNGRNLNLIDELFRADVVYNLPGAEPIHGSEGVKGVVTAFVTAFPDLKITVEQMIGEGETVVARVTPRGTNTGELMGNQPTGKQVLWAVVHLCRFEDGKVAEDRITYDQLGFMQQLGLAPA